MASKKGLVCGVGIYDSENTRVDLGNGIKVKCPFYVKWSAMIRRCYSETHRVTHPTYEGCSVCDEWLTFSNFKAWMEKQDWNGKDLDKDLLVTGNKIYSPETCRFLPRVINCFLADNRASRGLLKIGVTSERGKFKAACKNPFNGKCENLGRFKTEDEAHLAWKRKKHEFAVKLAETQTDEKVISALMSRYK